MMRRRVTGLLVAAALVPAGLMAQQTRNERLAAAQQAYDAFDAARAADLLRSALDPTAGPQDSAWGRGVQLLAQILLDGGDTTQAAVWARWAFRLAPHMTVDTVTFLPEVVSLLRASRTAAAVASPGDPLTRTTWQWSAPGAPAGQGQIRVVAPNVNARVNALVHGVGLAQSGQTVAARAGTYSIEVAADGYLPTTVTREVLPGVTTVLQFNLTPVSAGVLATDVRDAVLRNLVPLSVHRYGVDGTACATGIFMGGSGLVLTTYDAIRGADGVEAQLSSGRRVGDEIRVLAYDVSSNVAVLQAPSAIRTDSMPLASEVGTGQYVWGMGYPDCQTSTNERVRLGVISGATVALSDSLNPNDHVGPLVSSDGQLVGLAADPHGAITLGTINGLVSRARAMLNAPDKQTVAQVALKENHAYGAMTISADATGTTAQVTPLEAWQWPELAWSGPLPYTYAGPMGRYSLQVQIPGQAARQLQFTIKPGETDRFAVPGAPIAGGPNVPQVGGAAPKHGHFPWIIAAGGAAAVGVAAVVLMGGGGTPAPPPATTGGITISIPNP
jgi:hypothetical protein